MHGNSNIIQIPDVTRDERIGSVFNSLFQVIARTDMCGGEEAVWDFRNVSFLHPFFIFALRLYMDRYAGRIITSGIPSNVSGYFRTIHFSDYFGIGDKENLSERLAPYAGKSYLPICRWASDGGKRSNQTQSLLQQLIERQASVTPKVSMALSYMLSELIDNVEQHSESPYVYLFSQYIKSEGCIDLCIADEGITVYGSYARKRELFENIGTDEALALKLAMQGVSTKDRPAAENRGYGLSSSKAMLVDGLHGAFFMLSGGAFHRHEGSAANYVNLPEPIRWQGTVILLRIPNAEPADFDLYKYLSI